MPEIRGLLVRLMLKAFNHNKPDNRGHGPSLRSTVLLVHTTYLPTFVVHNFEIWEICEICEFLLFLI